MITVTEYSEQVCYIEIDRPGKLNALDKETIEKMIDFLKASASSAQFNVLVISGSNGFFSAGADLNWMKEGMTQSAEANIADAQLFNQLYRQMAEYPKPIIVRVDKGAYGGAIGLMACADVVITSPDAIFRFSETALGLIPATVAPYIVKKVGNGNARYLLLSGHLFNGDDAMLYGLVHILEPADTIETATRETAIQMAALGPKATQQTKKLLNQLDRATYNFDETTANLCASLIASARTTNEGQEGVTAFFEKRKPNWNR
jgi:methylglutaconyl-CoA hydratase